MMDLIVNLVSGLSLGSIYALIALGYTMVYGIAKMLNFAHGDIIMVGAFTVITTVSMLGLPPALGIIASIVCCVVLGVCVERIAYKPLRKAQPLAVLITAIGVSYFLQSLALLILHFALRRQVRQMLTSRPPLPQKISARWWQSCAVWTVCPAMRTRCGITS